MSPYVPLTFRAFQLLVSLERAVGGSAPAASWLAALAHQDRPLLETVPDGPDRAAALPPRPSAPPPGAAHVARTDLSTLAGEAAQRHGRTSATVSDVVEAILAAAERECGSPPDAAPPAPPEREPPAPPAPQPPTPAPGHPTTGHASPLPRPGPRARTFRVFVSSTFSDFAAERNVLRTRVWPELRAYCAARGARFQEIDLRWGVSAEAAVDQQTMNICLGEIVRCHATTPRPNFLLLLGNRRGWMPPPRRIPAGEWDRILPRLTPEERALLTRWYERDSNAAPPEYLLRARTGEFLDPAAWDAVERRLRTLLERAVASLGLPPERAASYLLSATEQEIELGALRSEDPDQVVCFLRHLAGVPRTDDGAVAPDAVDHYDDDQAPLEDLRARVRTALGPDRIIEELVPWGAHERDHAAYLDRFATQVLAMLRARIAEELAHPRHPDESDGDPHLDREGRDHRAFARERARFFVGRAAELAALRAHRDGTDPRPLVVHGDGGAGKSALLAAFAAGAVAERPTGIVVARHVGATPSSSDPRALLAGITRELARRTGDAEAAVPATLGELVADLRQRLARATADRPILVVVDSLDQLAAAGAVPDLSWIPARLPDHATLIVSTRPGEILDALRATTRLLELRGLTAAEQATALDALLADAGRTLQPAQRAHLLEVVRRGGGNPLHLRLAFEEARRWRSGSGAPPEVLGPDLRALLRGNMFDRLQREDQHGRLLVSHALGYLALARHGLAEDELVDLLSRDLDVYAKFVADAVSVPPDLRELLDPDVVESLRRDPARREELRALLAPVVARPGGPRLPVAVWSRLLSDLDPWLAHRRHETGDLLVFRHRELDDAATQLFASGAAGRELHSRLADYFQAWDVRGIGELPYHLTRAGRWGDAVAALTDLDRATATATLVGGAERQRDNTGAVLHAGVHHLLAALDDALAQLPDARERPEVTRR